MREVPRDEQFPDRSKEKSTGGEHTGSDQTQLAILTMLMRIYDLQMALLNASDPEVADRIFEEHNRGGHFNPMIYIPDFGDS